jgi:hypothetical protein
MDFPVTLLNLAGSVALLLWGVHMVQSGVQRAFGAKLRRFLAAKSAALRWRCQRLKESGEVFVALRDGAARL